MSSSQESRYKRSLALHIRALRSYCLGFDNGDYDAAFLMSNSLRIILKTKKKEKSILKHLGAENVNVLSTVKPVSDDDHRIMYEGILQPRVGKGIGCGLFAPLGNTRFKEYIPLADWYGQMVSKNHGHEYTRESIILCVAENDSGTHVDSELPKGYKKLKSGFWGFYNEEARERSSIQDVQLLMLRQISYEVLNSPEILQLAS